MANRFRLQAAVLIALGALAIGAPAQAFTFQQGDGSAPKSALQGDLPRYTDPDKKTDDNKAFGRSYDTYKFGGGSLTIGKPRSFDAQFNEGRERMLSPMERDR